jgi:hypothetical protein
MATAQGPHLESILAEAERLTRSRPMPSAPLRARLQSSPAIRRLAPKWAIVKAAEARGRAQWRRDPQARKWASAMIEAVVAGTVRAEEVQPLARQHLIEQAVQNALFWQQWRKPKVDRSSLEHLRAALSSERGVLLSTCHLGSPFVIISIVSALGRRTYSTASQWYFEEPGNDYWGRRLVRYWREVAKRDELVLPAAGSFPLLRQLLERGEVVNLYFDMPGRTETRFLGKPVMLASGTARLASESGSLILPIRNLRTGARVTVDVRPPLDPREFADHEALHRALAAIHERLILERPAALEDPNRPGAWEGLAGAHEWRNPRETRQLR